MIEYKSPMRTAKCRCCGFPIEAKDTAICFPNMTNPYGNAWICEECLLKMEDTRIGIEVADVAV